MAKISLKHHTAETSDGKIPSLACRPSKIAKRTARAAKRYKLSNIESLGRSNIIKDSAANAIEKAPNSLVLPALATQPVVAVTDDVPAAQQGSHFGKAVNELFDSATPKHKNIYKKEFKEAYSKFHGRSIVPFRTASGEIRWQLRGMISKLMHHQFLGTAAMREREYSGSAPFGGILADEMGFGKTVMMLANIIDGRIKDKKEKTLIVAAPALIRQWMDEIDKHCTDKAIGKVILYAPGSKIMTNNNQKSLKRYNIVLTTWNEVMSSLPNSKRPLIDDSPEGHQELREWEAAIEKEKGILHRVEFDRIVLDEAQAIKNHLSHRFRACEALKGKYRWAISGTPLQDRATETFAYFQFLKIPGPSTMRLFKQKYLNADKDDETNDNDFTLLGRTLSKFLIRRTHETLILGKPVLELPTCGEKTVFLEFSSTERFMYHKLDFKIRKAIAQILGEVEKGDIGLDVDLANEKAKERILILLLRLRQAVTQFILIAPLMKMLLNDEQQTALLTEALSPNNPPTTSQMKAMTKAFRHIAKRTVRAKPGAKKLLRKSFTKMWADHNLPALYSTKTRAIISQIQNWFDSDRVAGQPGGKIVIFAQFIEFIYVLENIFKSKGSRVINVDLWWNSAVEQQAFARVFRIGQTRKCEIVRFAVNGTHDERMLQLQDSKAAEIALIMNGRFPNGPVSKELLFVMGIDLEKYKGSPDEDFEDGVEDIIDFETMDVKNDEDDSDSGSSTSDSDDDFNHDEKDQLKDFEHTAAVTQDVIVIDDQAEDEAEDAELGLEDIGLFMDAGENDNETTTAGMDLSDLDQKDKLKDFENAAWPQDAVVIEDDPDDAEFSSANLDEVMGADRNDFEFPPMDMDPSDQDADGKQYFMNLLNDEKTMHSPSTAEESINMEF